VPMWRRGRPRRSASTTHRCAGSLARVYERTCRSASAISGLSRLSRNVRI
jgi:hypothetical protein